MVITALTVREVAKQLSYHPDHVYRLIKTGVIRAERFGRSWAITREEVQRIKRLQDENGRIRHRPD